jgi:hypothetical protein
MPDVESNAPQSLATVLDRNQVGYMNFKDPAGRVRAAVDHHHARAFVGHFERGMHAVQPGSQIDLSSSSKKFQPQQCGRAAEPSNGAGSGSAGAIPDKDSGQRASARDSAYRAAVSPAATICSMPASPGQYPASGTRG